MPNSIYIPDKTWTDLDQEPIFQKFMKELDVALKAVVEGLRTLAQGVEKIAEKLEGSVPKKRAKVKPARKTAAKSKKAAPKKAAAKKPASKKPAPKKTPAIKSVKETAACTSSDPLGQI